MNDSYAFSTAAVAVIVPIVIYAVVSLSQKKRGSSDFVKSFMKGDEVLKRVFLRKDFGDRNESVRDVARNVGAGNVVFELESGKLSSLPSPRFLQGGNVTSESFEKVRTFFADFLKKKIGRDVEIASLERVLYALTVSVGFRVSMDEAGSPIFLQPRYVLLTDSNRKSLRVVTYAFVGNLDSVRGDRPDTKFTPYLCRIVTSNLLRSAGPKRDDNFPVTIRCVDTSDTNTLDVIRKDIRDGTLLAIANEAKD